MNEDDDTLLDLMIEASVRASAGQKFEQVDQTHAVDLLEYQYGSTKLRRLPVVKPNSTDPTIVVAVRDGRTLDLPNKEFARVDIALSATCASSDRDVVYDGLVTLVDAMLVRELVGISAPEKAAKIETICVPQATLDAAHTLSLSLTYGLTINLGNYNFRKPTVGVSQSFVPSDFHAAWGDMAKWLMGRMTAQVKKARAPAKKDIAL